MSEASPAAIEPVNATATNVVEQPAKSTRGATPMESSFDDVIEQLSRKYSNAPEEGPKEKTLGEITEQVEREAKPAPKSPPKPTVVRKPEPTQHDPLHPDTGPEKSLPTKEKLKVGGEEFDLDADQVKRFAQKGIFYEKKNVEITKKERAIQEWEGQRAQEEQQKQAFFKTLGENPGPELERIYGPGIFEKMKPYAAQRVMQEMEYEQNPHLKAIAEANAERDQARAEAQTFRQQQEQAQLTQQAEQFQGEYENTIIEALKEDGIPKTDFTASEMAAWMERGLNRGIKYTPQQLAQIVREDNSARINTMTQGIVSQITEARKVNDTASIVKYGKAAVDMFGEPLMYAMAKYHLAKLQGGQPQQPKPILETPKVQTDKKTGWGKNGKQYMTPDEYADMRKKIARGEMEPPPGW